MATTEERNSAVLAVLIKADKPIGPTDIARQIKQQWCCFDMRIPYASAQSAAITPILKRIGAVRHPGGKWSAPAGGLQ